MRICFTLKQVMISNLKKSREWADEVYAKCMPQPHSFSISIVWVRTYLTFSNSVQNLMFQQTFPLRFFLIDRMIYWFYPFACSPNKVERRDFQRQRYSAYPRSCETLWTCAGGSVLPMTINSHSSRGFGARRWRKGSRAQRSSFKRTIGVLTL